MSRLLGWLTLFLVGTDLFVVSPLLPAISRELHVAGGLRGFIVTAFALAYVIGGPRLGAVADRVGRRPVLAVSLVVFAIANTLTAVAPDFVVVLVARFVAGLGASGITPSVYGMIGDTAPPERRATWLSLVTSGLLLALATGAPAGSLLSGLVGWRGVFYILAGWTIAILAVNLLAARPARGYQPARPTHADGQPAPALTRLRAVSVTGLWALAVYALYTFLGIGLRQSAHFHSGLIAGALIAYGAGAALGNLVGGPLADRYGGLPTTAVSLLALAILEATLALLLNSTPAAVIIGLALFAATAYPYFSAHQTRLVAAFPAQTGSLMAWNNTAMYAGILLGSAVGGAIVADAGYPVLLAAAAGVALIAAATTRWVISSRPSPRTHAERR